MLLETCEEQNAASAGYDMSLETRIETLDSHHGDSTPNIYDWCFAGVEESIKELSSWSQHTAYGQAPMSESVHDDEEADELLDNGPSFNLGWNVLPTTSPDDVPTADNRSTASSASDGDEEGPAYDLGWGAITFTMPSAHQPMEHVVAGPDGELEDEPAYDLGWGTTPTLGPQQDVIIDNDDDKEASPSYNLGWGVTSDEQPMQHDIIVLSNDDEPSHDLRWRAAASGLQPMEQDVIILSDDEDEDGPLYDLGWGVQATAKSRSSSPLTPTSSSPAPMDLDYDDRCPSPKDVEEDLYNAHPAKQSMLQENCWLKAIGNDMSDEHMHAIVENTVHGLNSSQVPAQILMENRHILGGSAEARNRVTKVGQDMCKLHRLVHLHCRLMKLVNHVIESLKNVKQ
ncbi:hypothetical protein EV702DRAFT_1049012 [Suillus placidus]|uniref:Uncharacterized protein n=1 Tax=Suillus placidus TaxID=48579 RepID=A0A9P7CYH6_9AGAM|nr:hypothetical protein EV702DRAFT_1049012 [Suillus placidus]